MDEWLVADEGQVIPHLDYDGVYITGTTSLAVDQPDIRSFTLDVSTGTLITSSTPSRIIFGR